MLPRCNEPRIRYELDENVFVCVIYIEVKYNFQNEKVFIGPVRKYRKGD